MRKLTDEYFANKQEQSKIKMAIHEAIPTDVYYHNLIIVLSEILQSMVYAMLKEEVFTKAHKATQQSVEPTNIPRMPIDDFVRGLKRSIEEDD